jgi:hypothetical protein
LEKDQENRFDLESFELAIRSSMHQVGQSMLELFINADITTGIQEKDIVRKTVLWI